MKFTSSYYPELIIADLGVTFRGGEAEVTDKAVIDTMRALPADLGVRASGGRPPKDLMPPK
ncbi:hypothetical protein [Actinokineospora inagensis]|uniref:hypothetical protein n=1 Tax=Actinokineospora inagensis TaxID=103730 RepID=UPI0003F764DD|nr:hypothetical protein [Actinokineospora inagensis]